MAVKATVGPIFTTSDITVTHSIVSTRKSAVKIGTESLADFTSITFDRIEAFDVDRGCALYAKDGGTVRDVIWRNIRLRFFDCLKEDLDGRFFDLEISNRTGLGHLENIVIENIQAEVINSAKLKGQTQRHLSNVTLRNISLSVQPPNHLAGVHSYLFDCSNVAAAGVNVESMIIDWKNNSQLWAGVSTSFVNYAPILTNVSLCG